ncbi:MAG TPA: hypothetical protein VG826_04225 [Pirellulales bacterium]|nr:hypothetical protein [Pirellulales bacterium]
MNRADLTTVPSEQLGAETAEMVQALCYGSFAPAFKDCIELAQKSTGVNFAAVASPREKIGDTHSLLIESGAAFQSAASDVGDREAFMSIDASEDVSDEAMDAMLETVADRGVELLV